MSTVTIHLPNKTKCRVTSLGHLCPQLNQRLPYPKPRHHPIQPNPQTHNLPQPQLINARPRNESDWGVNLQLGTRELPPLTEGVAQQMRQKIKVQVVCFAACPTSDSTFAPWNTRAQAGCFPPSCGRHCDGGLTLVPDLLAHRAISGHPAWWGWGRRGVVGSILEDIGTWDTECGTR